ncbi:hypothetical protein MYAM1_003066 [Malassezia yamatoensis]|uniref:Uncharacterized protein n=1 Tax=Malassezia yamatoensis TaxID=253288 RepID=A0AAJ6CHI7_9BASI|nr:hypothetical protein MYAM1_003066 [Malassezia yamatoensis]
MSYHRIHRTVSSASLHQHCSNSSPVAQAPHSAGSHRRAASVPCDADLEPRERLARPATIILRPASQFSKPKQPSEIFSFVMEPSNLDSDAPLETIPAVILGPQGTISGYIQMPITAGPGRRVIEAKPRSGIRRKAVHPPPELYSQALPPTPQVRTSPQGSFMLAPPACGLPNRSSPMRSIPDQRTSLGTSDERAKVTPSPCLHLDQLSKAETYRKEPITPRSPQRVSNRLEDWRKVFFVYAAQPRSSSVASSHLIPELDLPPNDSNGPDLPTPRRKASRMGLWKDVLRPSTRRPRVDPIAAPHDADIFERVLPRNSVFPGPIQPASPPGASWESDELIEQQLQLLPQGDLLSIPNENLLHPEMDHSIYKRVSRSSARLSSVETLSVYSSPSVNNSELSGQVPCDASQPHSPSQLSKEPISRA